MTINIDALLAPVSSDNSCGDNLEYHADYQAMEQASTGKAEQQFGETIIPAESADWNKVKKLAIDLLSRSKDLRVMLALTHDWTELKGLPGYAHLMLEKVKHYFAQHEPSHPAPLMIDRVQRLIELDFMDIIRDLSPDGVHQLENIFGRRN